MFSDFNFNKDFYVFEEEVLLRVIFEVVSLFFNILISLKSEEFERDDIVEGDDYVFFIN